MPTMTMTATEYAAAATAVAILAVLLYALVSRRRAATADAAVEGFEGVPTSFDLYRRYSSQDFDYQMGVYKSSLGDIKSLLHVYGCGVNLGSSPYGLDGLVKSCTAGLHVQQFSVLSNNFNDVNMKVLGLIEDFYSRTNRMPIKGQVYAVISQAPFYRDDANNFLAVQYNADNYLNKPTNVMKSNHTTGYPMIQFNGYLIFTAYTDKLVPIRDVATRKKVVINIKKVFRQKENLCFITCPQHDNLPCGCGTQDKPYLSNCLESGNPSKMSSGQKYTYAVLYRVNPRFADMFARDVLELDYSDLEWIPDAYTPIPTVQRPTIPPTPPVVVLPPSPPAPKVNPSLTVVPKTTQSDVYGKNNANSSFGFECARGKKISKIDGRGGSWVDALTVKCSDTAAFKQVGGNGGGPVSQKAECKTGYTAVKVTSGGTYIGSVQPVCAGTDAYKIGAGQGSGAGKVSTFACPSGQTLSAISGKAGTYINNLQFKCSN